VAQTAGSHRPSHRQKTLRPLSYPLPPHRPSRSAEYSCACCSADLSRSPRARCVECKNYDLCLDCLILGETSLRHRSSHAITVVAAITLMSTADMQPTALFEKLIDAVFDYIDATFPPRHTALLEPSKLSAFYSHLGVPANQNLFRSCSNDEISREFSKAGCEYHLTSDSVDAIAARATPWCTDSIDTTPRSPCLTRRGWIRFFVLQTWRDPDLAHFLLNGALATGKIVNKRKGEPYRLSCPRESLPRMPTRGREWESGAAGTGRRRAGSESGAGRRRARSTSRSRPSSRGP
jgi:hypothetical protein